MMKQVSQYNNTGRDTRIMLSILADVLDVPVIVDPLPNRGRVRRIRNAELETVVTVEKIGDDVYQWKTFKEVDDECQI